MISDRDINGEFEKKHVYFKWHLDIHRWFLDDAILIVTPIICDKGNESVVILWYFFVKLVNSLWICETDCGWMVNLKWGKWTDSGSEIQKQFCKRVDLVDPADPSRFTKYSQSAILI